MQGYELNPWKTYFWFPIYTANSLIVEEKNCKLEHKKNNIKATEIIIDNVSSKKSE